MKSISDKGYEFEPFEAIFLSRKEEILRLVDVTYFALRSMEGVTRLGKVLDKDDKYIKHVSYVENIAKIEIERDFPLIHNSCTVLIWGALEASFHDFLIRWLVKYPGARRVPELQKISVKVAEYESLDTEDRMRYLVRILEREFAAAFKPGVGRFSCLLKPFGIAPQINQSQRRNLNELAAIRNVIVHRAHVADSRIIELCPWLNLNVGQPVHVSREAFYRYVDAASNYTASIVESSQNVVPASNNTNQPLQS